MRSNKSLFCLFFVVTFIFIFTQAQPSRAQIPGMFKLYGEFKMPKVGAYATYKVTHTDSKAERIVKLAIVGKEKSEGGGQKIYGEGETKKIEEGGDIQKISAPKGENLYWYEVEETDPKTGAVTIIKMLISGNPQEIGTIRRMIMKSGKDKATELPPQLMQMINQPLPETTKVEQPKVKNLGTEKVKIKDKTLKCDHLQYISKDKATAEAWTNAEVPLFGLVKSISPESITELIEYGTDAKSAITEKPEVLEMPGLK